MDQIESVTTDNNVFNRQESIYNGSTTYSNFSEAIIVVWLRMKSAATNINFDSIESKIENSADLLKNFYGLSEDCEKYICSAPKNIKILFILFDEYATQALLKKVHDLPVIHSIYVHGTIYKKEEINVYPKIVNTYTDLHILTDDLCSKIYNYIRHAQLPMTIFKKQYEEDRSTNLLNKFAYFVDFWNPLFIDLLFDLPEIDYEQQKIKFLEQCRIYYRANESVLKVIDEFENTYKPEFAILWYQRDSFVYRLLNKAMRQQNIEGILIFRFFILDLFNELNKIYHEFIDLYVYQDNTYETVYRGQKMFINEIDKLKENLKHGTLIISINSFFSASRTQGIAVDFSGAIKPKDDTSILPDDIKSVLFEIEIKIDHKMQLKRKPFADVSHLWNGRNLDEQELIFMVDSFFQIDQIIENKEIETVVKGKMVKAVVTLVKLTFINEDDINISTMKDYQILKSTKTIEGKLIRIGNLLIDQSLSIGSPRSKADAYYKALFNEPKFLMTTACLTGQAWVALKRGEYGLAIKLALEALSIVDKSNDELTITTLNCLGGVYSELKNYVIAVEYYTQAFNLWKPTDDKIASNIYSGPSIPIDKYAMYDNYRNISSINIARIRKKNGDIQLAWNMYKEAIDYEMRDTTDFHCHTCMTIAESGTHEMITTAEEKSRTWKNWKSFLDLGLVDILKYRTPVVTGYLSFNHQYDFSSRRYNNMYCRTMAINYFRKVENQCEPYASNHEYYLYTLQCYERLAELYRDWDNRSIDYYEKMIQLCLKYHPDDLENIIISYKGMIETYKKQQSRGPDNSEDILMKLCVDGNDIVVTPGRTPMTPPVPLLTPPITPLKLPAFGIFFQNINYLHFAFDYYDKWIDPRLKNESDLRKKIIYCHMKLAALFYEQKKISDAKDSLIKTILLCQQFGSEMSDVRRICDENLSFIDMNFDSIIQSYKNRLSTITNIAGDCMNENNYCYIALLYEKKNDFNSAFEFLQIPIEYFEQYGYICLHTIDCYSKLAKYYQTIKNDRESAVNIYERAINFVSKHRSYPMTTTISIIEQCLINFFKNIGDLDTTILIYEMLCETVRHETTDITVLYNHLNRVLKLIVQKPDAFNTVLDIYEIFLNLILKIISPLTSQMTMVLIHFRDHFIDAYKKSNHLCLAIEIYQKLIGLLFKHQNDTMKIINEYKTIAAKFKTKRLLENSVTAYENLLDFVCQHHTTGRFIEDDLISFVFYIWKHEIIKQYLMENNFESAISLHYKMIHFLETYRLNINTKYNLNEFIQKTLQNYDEIAIIYQLKKNNLDQTMNIYQEQIEFMTKYEIETVQQHISTIISKCQQFATVHKEQAIELYSKLIIFIERNRLQYLSHLSIAYKELIQLNHASDKKQQCTCIDSSDEITTDNYLPNSCRVVDLKQRVLDYKEKAKHYLDNKQFDRAIEVYRTELLPFLLENHARDDEHIATCYRQIASLYYEDNEKNAQIALNYYKKTIDIYEIQKDNFYTEYAFELNPNVCRRYAGILFMCYNIMKTIYIVLNDRISSDIYKQKGINIYEKHKDQFQFNGNPATNIVTVEIRPFVELSY